jgi:hypothetical protein
VFDRLEVAPGTSPRLPRKSVLFIINSLQRGRAQKQVIEAAARLAERGWRTSVLSLLPLTPLVPTLQDRNVVAYPCWDGMGGTR